MGRATERDRRHLNAMRRRARQGDARCFWLVGSGVLAIDPGSPPETAAFRSGTGEIMADDGWMVAAPYVDRITGKERDLSLLVARSAVITPAALEGGCAFGIAEAGETTMTVYSCQPVVAKALLRDLVFRFYSTGIAGVDVPIPGGAEHTIDHAIFAETGVMLLAEPNVALVWG